MNRIFLLVFGTAAALSASMTNAAIMVFDNHTDWTSGLGGASTVLDAFDNEIPSALSITLDSGIISTNSGQGQCCGDNSVSSGVYNNAVEPDGSEASISIDWLFPTPVFALAFDYFDVNFFDLQISIDDGTGGTFTRAIDINGSGSGFAGFISDNSFASVTFSSGDAIDVFELDNVEFAATVAVDVPVPMPATLSLLGLGLVALRSQRRA
ncbi:MAG: PEP-CTERM sorting domain-containing protein [Pseudomonadota bacterium]